MEKNEHVHSLSNRARIVIVTDVLYQIVELSEAIDSFMSYALSRAKRFPSAAATLCIVVYGVTCVT